MGAGLIVGILEMEKGKEPDWEAARTAIGQLSVGQRTEVLERLDGYLEDRGTPEWQDALVKLDSRLHEALDELQLMWKNKHGCAVRRTLSGGDVLIFGGSSWGDDPFEGYDDVCAVADLVWTAAGGRYAQ